MQTGQEKFGMQTMNQSLLGHYLRRNITLEEVMLKSPLPDELTQMIQRAQQSRGEGLGVRRG
jgi:twitching motility protein PilT